MIAPAAILAVGTALVVRRGEGEDASSRASRIRLPLTVTMTRRSRLFARPGRGRLPETVARVNAESLTPCRRANEDPFLPSPVSTGGRRCPRHNAGREKNPPRGGVPRRSTAAGARQRPRALRD